MLNIIKMENIVVGGVWSRSRVGMAHAVGTHVASAQCKAELTEVADDVGKVATPQSNGSLLLADASEAVDNARVPLDLSLYKVIVC